MTDEYKNHRPYATGQCRAKIPKPVVWLFRPKEQVNDCHSPYDL